MKVSSKFTALLSQQKIDKVVQVAYNLNINPNWLLAVMYFETARTFDPAKTNSIGSVGLIQFTRDKAGVQYKTIAGKQFYLNDLKRMSFVQQMDVVEMYYKDVMRMTKKPIKSFVDCYLVTFFPNALGKTDSYVFETKGLSASLIAKQNPIFDRNKDGKITKSEVVSFFRESFTKAGFNFDSDVNISKFSVLSLAVPFFLFFYTYITYTL